MHNLDVMHIKKNVCSSIVGILLKLEGKSEDTNKARLDIEDKVTQKGLHLIQQGGETICCVLFKLMNGEFCKFLKIAKFPYGYVANISKYVK